MQISTSQYIVLLGVGGGLAFFGLEFACLNGPQNCRSDAWTGDAQPTKSLDLKTYLDFFREKDPIEAVNKITNRGPYVVIVSSPSAQAYA